MSNGIESVVWDAIRIAWEYDKDEPSMMVATRRAAEKHGFIPPSKTSVHRRMLSDKKNKNPWERRASLVGINQAAHRKADAMVYSDGERKAEVSAGIEQAVRSESEDARAEVLARHRNEWKQVVQLRQESIAVRKTDPDSAFNKARLAKIMAEITKIQQDGERRAWGLDDSGFDPSKLSDKELDDVIRKG